VQLDRDAVGGAGEEDEADEGPERAEGTGPARRGAGRVEQVVTPAVAGAAALDHRPEVPDPPELVPRVHEADDPRGFPA
jgi:hypothetical protein